MKKNDKVGANSRWNLYWVSSDGEEDCFVVARSSLSARKVEVEYCGFDRDQVIVTLVKNIPEKVFIKWNEYLKRKKDWHALPWYAEENLLKRLGAEFRNRDGLEETLIDDIVYTRASDGPCEPRSIGRKALLEMWTDKKLQSYREEDNYSKSQVSILTMLGICVARVQEIEDLIANSFIFGVLVESDRRKNVTIGEIPEIWKKKTLGQMLRLIEENWEIEPIVRSALQMFLQWRNRIMHGITIGNQFNIYSYWGQAEMVPFLSFFELVSRPIRRAFRSSFYSSVHMGYEIFMKNEGRRNPLTKKQEKEMDIFVHFFKLKDKENLK